MDYGLSCIPSGILQANTWIVPLSGRAVLAVDPAACIHSHDSNRISSWLSERGLGLFGIVLTHGHFDHITGTAVLKEENPSCRIAVHGADARMAGSDAAEVQGAALERMGVPYARQMLCGLPDADELFFGGEALDSVFSRALCELNEGADEVAAALSEWKIIHTPGHTPGSSCLYNGARKILVSGDTVFYQTYGRTDLEGGSGAQMRRSLSNLRKTIPQDAAVYPGHGEYGFPLSMTLPK